MIYPTVAAVRLVPLYLLLLTPGIWSSAQEATPDKASTVVKWRAFVGEWLVTTEDGARSETTIIESHPGVFVHRGDDFTVMVGWDASHQAMHAFGYSADDQPFEQLWRPLDEGISFRGTLVGTDDRFKWSIVDEVWTMDFGRFGKMTAVRKK